MSDSEQRGGWAGHWRENYHIHRDLCQAALLYNDGQ